MPPKLNSNSVESSSRGKNYQRNKLRRERQKLARQMGSLSVSASRLVPREPIGRWADVPFENPSGMCRRGYEPTKLSLSDSFNVVAAITDPWFSKERTINLGHLSGYPDLSVNRVMIKSLLNFSAVESVRFKCAISSKSAAAADGKPTFAEFSSAEALSESSIERRKTDTIIILVGKKVSDLSDYRVWYWFNKTEGVAVNNPLLSADCFVEHEAIIRDRVFPIG